jgi:hypothetical protein
VGPSNIEVGLATCHSVDVDVLWQNGPPQWHPWLGVALCLAAMEEVAAAEVRDVVGDRNAERVHEARRL